MRFRRHGGRMPGRAAGLPDGEDMADYDRPTDTTVVHTDGGGNGGLYAVLIVVVILLVAGFVWFSGGFGTRSDNSTQPDIQLNVPQAPAPKAPDVNINTAPAPSAPSSSAPSAPSTSAGK